MIRVAPPPGHPTSASRWVLIRAFAPADAPVPAPPADAALATARALFLAARIGCRHPAARLATELGPDAAAVVAAQGFAADHRGAVARGLLLGELARELAAVARSLDLPLGLLKFAALRATGVLLAGSRVASDLDVLVAAGRAAELQEALLERGFTAPGLSAYEHQLPLISHPRLGAVEVHLHVPGLTPPGGGRGFARFEDLESAGALEAAADDGLLVPTRPVLLAHTLAHGLLQHGWAPGAYPPFRMVSDLVDLGLGAPEGDGLLESALAWIAPGLGADEARAIRELCARLVGGELAGGGAGSGIGGGTAPDPAARLLGHFLAGALDPVYRRSLGLHRLAGAATEGHGPSLGRAAAWRRRITKALVPTRAEVDTIYGRRHGRAGYLARIAVRPFDLAWRLARAAAAWLAVRLRR